MSPVTRYIKILAAACALLAVAAVGCSKKRGTPFDPDAGHPEDFFPTHGASSRAAGASCPDCHGSDLLGGIAAVSCFSASRDAQACHPGGPGGHPAGWRAVHGATDPAQASTCAGCHDNPANDLPPNCFNTSLCHGPKTGHPAGWRTSHSLTSPSRAGYCAQCHDNPANGLAPGCFNTSLCHGPKSPHPPGWLSTHPRTSPGEAGYCAQCHDNPNNDLTPGCFNTSLCHGAKGGHPAGWSGAAQHGAAAKSSNGFSSCQPCHGSGFTGGTSGQSCFPCHGWSAPHARSTWDGGGGGHRSTSESNAGVCAQCHRKSSGNAGCFNNTLCHGAGGGHPAGWDAASQHGAAAKAANGLGSCRTCHGSGFTGGTSGQSCFPCHGWSAPHARSGWDGGGSRHRSTNTSNATVCAQCHPVGPPTGGSTMCTHNGSCHED